METRRKVPAEWIEDGFFHPPARLGRNFVDVDDFLHLRLAGIRDDIQFFHIRIGTGNSASDHIVVHASGVHTQQLVENAVSLRYPAASCAFLVEQRDGYARVAAPTPITFSLAAAAALTSYSVARDESRLITIEDGRTRYVLQVSFDGERHWVAEIGAA